MSNQTEKTPAEPAGALLPEDAVCWEEGPWPDSIESALNFLVEHLSSNTNQTGGGQ